MVENEGFVKNKITNGAIIAEVIPFLTIGSMSVLHELPRDVYELAWLQTLGGYNFIITLLLVPALGVGVGWVKGFPRWAYAYIGQALIFSLYLSVASTPGIQIFGYQVFGRQMWGLRTWAPLVLALAIGLLITRSIEPLGRLFKNAWEDWTLITFSMFAFMPLVVWFSFDEIDRAYSLSFMVVTGIFTVVVAWIYMASTRHSMRVAALVVGVFGAVIVATVGPTIYWNPSGGVYIPGMIVMGLVVLAVILSPALIGVVKRMNSGAGRPGVAR